MPARRWARLQPRIRAHAEMLERVPAAYVDAFFSFFADGTPDESEVLPTVEQISGRTPRTFAERTTGHASAFR